MMLSELIERREQDRLKLGLEWLWLAPEDHPVNRGVLAKDLEIGKEIAGLKRDLQLRGNYEVREAPCG
jgi:hypothetical protein